MQHHPCPQEYVAVNDRFGESGPPMELMKKYGLGVEDIITAIKRAIKRKKL
jgi:transketolase